MEFTGERFIPEKTDGIIATEHYHRYLAVIEFLKKNDYLIVSTALHKDSISYEKIIQKDKNAYIFGNEGGGVSDYLIEQSDIKSIIPIYGDIESLNVSVASGIFLYKMKEKQEELKNV